MNEFKTRKGSNLQTKKTILRFSALALIAGQMAFHQTARADETAVLFGLIQPILFGGYNVEVNYRTDAWVFEYSHGWDLKISDFEAGLTDDEKNQKLKIFAPYSTGGGVGYRFTNNFHGAIEYKIHEFEVTHAIDGTFKYTVQTLGIGLYYHWKPFKNSGFTVVPAIRYWPTIATSMKDNKKVFSTGEVHEAHGFDVAPNIKIGWSF